MTTKREFDLILWGATGFTGRLAAAYLARHSGAGTLKWALAGRNIGKLEELRAQLSADHPALSELPLIEGESLSDDSMGRLAARTRVVASLVGPYARYGSALVGACAEHGTHYCDITGEPHWIRNMIDAHHATAQRTGARVVHCCGFDSVPFDMGMWMLQSYARDNFGARCDRVTALVHGKAIRASGGTVSSALCMAEELSRRPELARFLVDPYSLDPEDARGSGPATYRALPSFDADRQVWTAPFVMSLINTRIVRRSNALLGHPYGRAVRYDERVSTGHGPRALAAATFVSAALGIVPLSLRYAAVRRLMQRFVLPAPGEGPTPEQRAQASFTAYFHGRSADGGLRLKGTVTMPGDPAYDETATMVVESALCLAQDSLESPGGILTTASAMGAPLLERLRAAGHSYQVEVESASEGRLLEHTHRKQVVPMAN